ncbi:MAG: class I SAM-dependent DNA methyltransferase [Planctomycetota bacterium]
MSSQSETSEINDFGPITEVYEELVEWAPYEKWIADLLVRLRRYGLEKGDHLLDLACGTGLSTYPLARRGYRVSGVDISESMLQYAREKQPPTNGEVEFQQANIVDLDLGKKFDAVVCMHSGLDYILDLEDLQTAFHRIRAHTVSGGLFAFDKCLHEPSFYQEATVSHRELSQGRATIHYSWDRDNRLFRQRCRVVTTEGAKDNGAPVEVIHKMRAVDPTRLVDMVEEADFRVLERPGTFTISDPAMGIFEAVQ